MKKPDLQKIKDILLSDKKRLLIIAGAAIILIAVIIIAAVAAGNAKKAEAAAPEIIEEETEAEAQAETAECRNVVPLSADGPVFPSLDLAIVPTEEPIPEYITVGVKHSFVQDIQQRLMDLGFMDVDEPTDYYGEATKESVRKFQRQHELDQDGVIGSATLELLFSEEAKHYAAKEGDTGDDIISIQERLYQLGYLADRNLVTGMFGEKTKEAVIKLQEVNKLTPDGMVGRATYNLIYSDEVAANFLTYGEHSDVVLKCQQRLFNLGYMTSSPDGSYGDDTYYAIKNFQRKNALVVDGYLGPETREVLMSDRALPNGLGLGDQNEQVTKVQQLLVKYGYLSSKRATGYFGEITQKAVKNFQKRNGLKVDGMVGAKTLAMLTSDNPKKAASGMLDGANFNTATTAGSSGGSTSSAGGSTSAGAAAGGGAEASAGSGTDAGSTQQTTGSGTIPNTDANGVSSSVANLLAIARSKVGCPYVWGSKGPNSFDCSGFVNYVLNQAGVQQSYITSAGWRNVGKYTRIGSYNELRAGDIIVVNGHVGFISTGGYIIDASSSNGRVIERSLGSWWANHFIVGWRIF